MSLVPLHVHSSYSLLDSTLKITDAVNFAKEHGMNACALTEHGVMHGFVEQAIACKKAGMKPTKLTTMKLRATQKNLRKPDTT